MPPLRPFEQIDAGGVDSRSNPVNMPRNRALRCLNWVPKNAGFWEQRWGYSSVTMSSVLGGAITGLFPYRTWDGHKFVVFVQGTTLQTIDTATGTVTTPTVLGTPIASSAKGNAYFAANRLHYGNGTDQKWFDSTNWRNNGLPALTVAQIQNVIAVEGVRELTPSEASSITLTVGAGGGFPGDSSTGHLIYVCIFDTSNNEIGPATISVGPGRVFVGTSQKITVGNMPDLSATNVNWVKLLAGTIDGGNLAWFFTNTSNTIATISLTPPASFGTQVTVITNTNHGLSTGDIVRVVGSGSSNYDGLWTVTVVSLTKFTYVLPAIVANVTRHAGTVMRIVTAANSATSIDILGATQDNPNYQVNQNIGFAASTIGGPTPGYQFYGAIYNPNGGGHVGNRIAMGSRLAQTAYRVNIRLKGLPDLSGTDPEWCILIGRTGDGAQVPYVCADASLNWTFAQSGQTTLFVNQGNLDSQHELPTRNGIIPSQCNMFCVAGDFAYAADSGSPFLRRSGDLSQNTERGDTFTGRAEQSWAPNDVDTFPTAEACTGIFEVDQEVFMGTLHDCALSVNLAGVQQWNGPWNVGIAGPRAATKCGANGFYWVTGDKQLATFQQGVPVIASEEYEAAELSQIGDQFLSTVECVYIRNGPLGKDELRIEAQKGDGTPYTIIHDFRLRDYQAPGSWLGQGYSSQFAGPLGTAFTSSAIRDGNGKLQIWAGASNGQLYQEYTGANDAGTEFTSDLILLVNGGPDRPDVPFIDFYGDQNINMTVGRNFQTSLALGSQFGFDPPNADADQAQLVPGAENDFLFRQYLVPPEVQRLYARFQLTSHSVDGTLALNSPPHIPLESYGRLYELVPAIGDTRER